MCGALVVLVSLSIIGVSGVTVTGGFTEFLALVLLSDSAVNVGQGLAVLCSWCVVPCP